VVPSGSALWTPDEQETIKKKARREGAEAAEAKNEERKIHAMESWNRLSAERFKIMRQRNDMLVRAEAAEAALKDAEITLIAAREAGAENLERAKAAEARVKETG